MSTQSQYFLKRLGLIVIAALLTMPLIIVSSCGDDEPPVVITPEPEPVPTESTVAQILESLGGIAQINELSAMSYITSAKTYEYEEAEPIQPNPILTSNTKYKTTAELTKRKVRIDYSTFDVTYPVGFSSTGSTKIINDKSGSQSGQYSVVSFYFGAVAPTALLSNRIESDLKNYTMSNPLELIKRCLNTNADLTVETEGNKLLIPTNITDLNIELTIDLASHLPVSATIKESDFLHGDVDFSVAYKSWAQAGDIMYPDVLEYIYNGDKLKEEVITQVIANPQLENDAFTVEEVPAPHVYDEALGERGIYHTQWFSRLGDSGLAIDIPMTVGAVAGADWTQFGIPDQTISPDVKIIGRPDLLYWAVAIKTAEGVLIVDAPLNQEWCKAIIDVVNGPTGFPDEEIIGIIPTHTHYDHFGGIRELAAATGLVYTTPSSTSTVQSILSAEHSLVPDALSSSARTVSVVEIDDILILDNGKVEIHNVTSIEGGSNPHADDMLIVYMPELQLILQADLFNAGGLLALFAGQGAAPLGDVTKTTWNERSKYLLRYIEEKDLKVSQVVGMHGGLGSIGQVQFVGQ